MLTEIADNFPYLRLNTYRNILSNISIGFRGVVDSIVALQSLGCGFASRWPHLFSVLLLQCESNINLLSMLRFSYFFNPYDAQAYSALINPLGHF